MRILHFADLHLGVETYGKIDPDTGLSTRLGDFLAALDKLVDYALNNEVDLVVFCGDAYKSREPSQTQQREFAKRINRLTTNDIPIFLLVGNHDLPNAIGKATSTEIFDTLAVKNVYVSNKPEIYRIETRSGIIQVASLPWLRRSGLLRREEMKNLNLEQINENLEQVLKNTIDNHAGKLDPALPAILAAHVGVANATVGSERLMAIGQEHFLLPGNIANPAFDYIALGHIHNHQVLSENPPVVYAGSLERVDFGEEDDDKGFYTVDIDPNGETGGSFDVAPSTELRTGPSASLGTSQDRPFDQAPSASLKTGPSTELRTSQGRRKVSYRFHPLVGRTFRTVNVNIEPEDTDPTEKVLKAIEADGEDRVSDAIVRLQVSMPMEAEGQLRDNDIRDALKGAYYSTIAKDVRREARIRFGEATAEEIPPIEALKKYLEANYPSERAKILFEYGERLILGEEPTETE